MLKVVARLSLSSIEPLLPCGQPEHVPTPPTSLYRVTHRGPLLRTCGVRTNYEVVTLLWELVVTSLAVAVYGT